MILWIFLSTQIFSSASLKLKLSTKYIEPSKHLLMSSEQIFPLREVFLQYFISMNFASPTRKIDLGINTEQPWLWLPSSECDCHDSINYDPIESSSYKSLDLNKTINYTLGSISGIVSEEIFRVKEANFTNEFILVKEEDGFQWLTSDGYVGLGLTEELRNNSIIDSMYFKKIITKRQFGVFISKDEANQSSELILGDVDPDDYSHEAGIALKINGNTWRSDMNNVKVGNELFNSTLAVIFDPSVPLIFGPEKIVENLQRQINETSQCVYKYSIFLSCNNSNLNFSELPAIIFQYDNYNFTISPSSYFYMSEDDAILLIISNNSSEWTLGQPFFKEYFAVFSMDELQMVFYKALIKSKFSIIYLIVALFVVIVVLVPAFVYCFISKNIHLSVEIAEPLIKTQ